MRVALLGDYLEEKWPSMDLFANQLFAELGRPNFNVEKVEMIRPAMKRRFSRVDEGSGFTMDRLANRFFDYPAALGGLSHKFDVFHIVDHSYSQLVNVLPTNRSVVTCHDVDTFRCLWEPDHQGRGLAFRLMTKRILSGMQKGTHVCCDSDATRDEVVERGLSLKEQTSVVPLGVHPAFNALPEREAGAEVTEMLEKLSGDDRDAGDTPAATVDLLHVGSTITRKRVDILLKVFAELYRRDSRVRLLRVGGKLTPEQQSRAKSLGVAKRVITFPFLTMEQLAAVYRRAALVLLPSEAEGFGFPVIEALASGTPVVASDLPVLREVGGKVAEYVGVGLVDEWVAKIEGLLAEKEHYPERWNDRRESCRAQAAKFTWVETARRYREVYREVFDRAQHEKS